MKKLFSKDHLPAFLQNDRLRLTAIGLVALAMFGVILAFFINFILGIFLLVLFAALVGTVFYALETVTKNTNKYISDLSYRIKRGEQEALIKMPIGILLYSEENEIEWTNPYLQEYLGKKEVLGEPIATIDPELAKLIAENEATNEPKTVRWGDNQFEIIIQEGIRVVYLLDITRYAKIEERYNEEQLAIGQIFLDNYDEITQTMTDKSISNLNNYVTNELSNWARHYGMFLKRVDDDHFFLLTYAKALKEIEADNFKILDRIRDRTSKQNYPLTLSVGIANGDTDLAKLATVSQSNLDLALGRGGDQVVVKAENGQARFYGGKTNPMEKRTRVRARMISQALQEVMNQVDQVFVMGHAQPDMDSLGACLGIRRIAAMNGKKCSIVVNQEHVHTDIQRLLAQLQADPEIGPDILTPDQAPELATNHSLLVMVDHSKPSISTSPILYHRLANRTIIIDHHRRGEEFPENPMLVYIEPYASSTCELITEMFEYQPKETEAINKLEATAMLAGITVDTKSFSLRTGTRTFDAASYLRSVGADAVMVQRLLKENVDNYIQKNHLIESIEFIRPNMALCLGEEDETYDPVIAAQAADTLLSLSGIDASFVITRRPGGDIGISARSLGEVNVQVIMEQLGGGGHLSNAATQLQDSTVAAARDQLEQVITKIEQDTAE
ncbi:DHH family phosphoesterase [Loigolactobacillus coryniformis]|uniref:Cyclic-di-AMP phosphodiesterase n=1 Tax=Loigolactobacillus coryniformis subsp. coryniformis CECT 5711 TaxID=1185325 RepID=J3JA42_9LACO|nr:DHH family phosphoesterase [Loigolactobacillus coryniformis]EJN54524.1 Putative exopolyphosphatase-related protein [Loigolactobacillus coryniformis subsp. coryniformis CECT 5711]